MFPFWMREMVGGKAKRADLRLRNPLLFRRAADRGQSIQAAAVGSIPRVLEVVIVNDGQNTADELVELIRRGGHAARLAYDRRDALRLLADQAADVVLLDLDMPRFDGCSLAKQLRVDFPGKECFIIAVTDKANKRCRRTSLEAGIDLVLIKPVALVIVETLLLLECVRVNRLDSQHKADLVTKETAPRKHAARWDMEPPESRS